MRSLLLSALLACLPCFAAERVEIPTAGLSSSPEPLVGHLFLPEAKPRAAIVLMHGCGGAYASSGALNARHSMWADYLHKLGYAVLMLDSFTSRGLRQICTVKTAERTIKEADRVGDAYAAHAFLRARLGVESKRIGLLGWSHGGGTVLSAIGRKPANASAFGAAVAFYPGCRLRAQRADTYHPYAPVVVLIGEADDWTPAAPCKTLIDTVTARGEPASIVVYPGAYHDFDSPALKALRVRTEVPNGARPGEGVTVAPDPKAREDAKVRVKAFFEKYLE